MKSPRTKLRPEPQFAAFAPLKFFIAYLAVTLSIAVWGPMDYYAFPIGKTLFFMGAVMISITFGYIYGNQIGVRPARRHHSGSDTFVRILFDVSLIISLIALFVSIGSALTSGQLNTDLSGIGDAYMSGYEDYERNSGSYSLAFIIYSLSLPFNFISMVLGLYYFFSMNRTRRALLIVFIVGSLLFYVVGSGKQKQIGDVLVYLIAVAALKYGVWRRPIKIKWVLVSAALAIMAIMLFVAVLGQRYSAIGVDVGNVNQRINDRVFFETSHPIFKLFGLDYGLTLSIFLSYLSQGYYGLGLALETPWQWTHFMGFSYSVSVLANRLFGFDWEWPNALVSQVGATTGWGESKWHTVFTHFATDFTFPGTVLIFGYFAYVYSRAWTSAVRYENPFAILTFALLTMGAFFMPANNQLLHSPGALFTTIVVTGLYLWFGQRFNRVSTPWKIENRRRTRTRYKQ